MYALLLDMKDNIIREKNISMLLTFAFFEINLESLSVLFIYFPHVTNQGKK